MQALTILKFFGIDFFPILCYLICKRLRNKAYIAPFLAHSLPYLAFLASYQCDRLHAFLSFDLTLCAEMPTWLIF